MIRAKGELRAFYEGTDRIPDALLVQWTERLKAGERGKKAEGLARSILKDFALRQWLGQAQSAVTLSWLADALDSVLDHADPFDAFGLAKRPNKRPPNPQVSMEVAWWVALTERRGYSAAEAKELAAARFARDTKTIERDKKKSSAWVAGMNPDADWDAYFLARKPSRPLPPRRDEK